MLYEILNIRAESFKLSSNRKAAFCLAVTFLSD